MLFCAEKKGKHRKPDCGGVVLLVLLLPHSLMLPLAIAHSCSQEVLCRRSAQTAGASQICCRLFQNMLGNGGVSGTA